MHLFQVPDLKCGGCLGFVVRALQDVDHAIRIEANVPGRTIKVLSHRFETPLLQAPAEPATRPIRSSRLSDRSGPPYRALDLALMARSIIALVGRVG